MRDPAFPNAPLSLLVVADDPLLARVIANVQRPNLARAGMRCGTLGFDLTRRALPPGLISYNTTPKVAGGGSMSKVALAALLLALIVAPARAQLSIVAAENFYGDVVRQIGGAHVSVVSILSNPDQDPHLFEASPSVARNLSAAALVVVNGLDYDPWAAKLLAAARNANRRVIVVGELAGKRPGDNPHVWYDPAVMLALANALADALGRSDPAHAADYAANLAAFQHSVAPVTARIAAMRIRLAGVPATATEPVFGAMFEALGMTVRNQAFQLAVMNNTEPSASDIVAFENDLRTRQVKLLVYNSQATDAVAIRMVRLARASQVPVVAVTETEPAGKRYQAWMLAELDAVDQALPAK